MEGNTMIIVIGIVLVFLFIVYFINKDKPSYPPPRENANLKAYSFGFPTHGSYNYGGGPLRGWPKMWSSYGYGYPKNWKWYNPYGYGSYGYGPLYYQEYVKPYLTGECYSSNETESCETGYSKIQKHSGGEDGWSCCRNISAY